MGGDLRCAEQMKVFAIILLALAFSVGSAGCTLSTTLDQGITHLENASGDITRKTQDWNCLHMSVRQWQLTYGVSDEMADAWLIMCQAVRSPPRLNP